MRIPIKALKDLSKKYNLSHVILYAYGDNTQHVVTFGKTTEQAGQAADFGNKIKTNLGWAENTLKQPSRVRKLQEEIKKLRLQLHIERKST